MVVDAGVAAGGVVLTAVTLIHSCPLSWREARNEP
jgi:hypothetical protein